MHIQYATHLLLSCWFGVLAGQTGCPYKKCTCGETDIFCQNLGLLVIPSLLDSEATANIRLTFDTNNITAVPAGSFPRGLKEISFADNPITTIDVSAFDGSASTLQTLSFSNARFTRIPDAFLHLKSLQYLSISHTFIQDWNVNAMKNIGSTMQNLLLEDVGLTTWPDWVQYFTQLNDLSITSSSISYLPDNALHNQANSLRTLTLMNNSLVAVPKALSELNVLFMLNLINTKISDLTYLPQASPLSSLALDNTSLTDSIHISNMLQPYALSLSNIYLEGNQLDSIPNLSFLTQLGSITLSHNRISDHNSGSMPSGAYNIDLGYNRLRLIPRIMSKLYSVTSFVLPWNNIQAINDGDFHTSITSVDIGFNLITELTDTSFPVNSRIQILNLNSNPILKISAQAFQNLQQLTDLSMRNTKLIRMPLSLSLLSNLKSLDVTGSHTLVCTCTEKSLRFLMTKLDNILGNCGMTTVSNFFLNLSSSCPP